MASELLDRTPRDLTMPPLQDGTLTAGLRGTCMAQLMWRCRSKLPPFAGVLTIPPWALGDRKGPGKAARPTALAPKPELFCNSRLHLLPSRALQLSLPPLKRRCSQAAATHGSPRVHKGSPWPRATAGEWQGSPPD